MKVRWIAQKQANAFVIKHHRHHNAVVGAILCLGLFEKSELIGVAIIGRPVARKIDFTEVVEVTRLCTNSNKNACSKLYSACARIAKEMGFSLIQTYILESETGVSLKASGWELLDEKCGGKTWNDREHKIVNLFGEVEKRPQEYKQRWGKYL